MHFKKIQLVLILLVSMFGLMFVARGKTTPTPKISVNFTNINTRDLLKILAEHTHKNVIISDKINSKVTLNLTDVSWQEAFNTVLTMQGLVKRETGKVIIINVADELSKNEQLIPPPKIFSLRYVSADSVSKLLKPAGILSPHGKSAIDVSTNSLVITDTDDKSWLLKSC